MGKAIDQSLDCVLSRVVSKPILLRQLGGRIDGRVQSIPLEDDVPCMDGRGVRSLWWAKSSSVVINFGRLTDLMMTIGECTSMGQFDPGRVCPDNVFKAVQLNHSCTSPSVIFDNSLGRGNCLVSTGCNWSC